MKGERVLATVGSEEQTLGEMHEAQAQQPLPVGVRKAQRAMEQFIQQNEVLNVPDEPEVFDTPAMPAIETPVVEAQPEEQPVKKKRGRPRKVVEPVEDTQQSIEIPEKEDEMLMPVTDSDVSVQDQLTNIPARDVFEIEGTITATGTLEILPEGYGFLRSADYNYISSPDDVYVTQQQIRRYALKPGDTVECTMRSPKDNERFFPMSKVIRVNGISPEKAAERVAFEN